MLEQAKKDLAAEREEAEEAPGPRRHTWRQRAIAALLAISFLLLLAWPFFLSPRVRWFLTPVPRMGGAHAATPVSLRAEDLRRAEAIVFAEVEREAFPGAALVVGQRGATVLERGYGRIGWTRFALPVDPDRTLYDLSSLTKVVATTAAVMVLVDDGRMRLDDPLSRWLPTFRGGGRERVTVRQVLSHTSGLPAAVLELGEGTPRQRLERLIATVRLIEEPGVSVLYSDTGFLLLGEAAARAAGEPLPALLRRRVWEPLGMRSTRFQPGLFCQVCAPTLSLKDGSPFAGKTNDPFARELGGATGNAGLFTTAHDLGRFVAMLASGGELDGVRIVRASTLAEFTRPGPRTGTRALGFEVFCREGTVPNHVPCKTEPYAYGHTGYTGTSFWIEPKSGAWVVLLTNRTYLPRAPDRIRLIRRRLFETVTGRARRPTAPARRNPLPPDGLRNRPGRRRTRGGLTCGRNSFRVDSRPNPHRLRGTRRAGTAQLFQERAMPSLAQRVFGWGVRAAPSGLKQQILQKISSGLSPLVLHKYVPQDFGAESFVLPMKEREPAVVCPQGMPVPPPELSQGYDAEGYLASGRQYTERMLGLLRAGGFELGPGMRVLDWGCAAGRMVRWLKDAAESGEVWGTDVSAPDINWARTHLSPPFRFATITAIPHLPFEDRYFDLIYASSIFTHIDDLSDAWLLELRRVLKPGGRAFLTIHDERTMEIASANPVVACAAAGDPEYQEFVRSNFAMFSLRRVRDSRASQVFYRREFFVGMVERSMFRVLDVVPEALGYQTGVIVTRT